MSRIKISRVVANVLDNSFLTVLSNNIVATLLTTSNVAEGANLYFSNTRARAAVGAVGSNLVYYEANGNFQVIVSGGGGAVDSVNGLTGTVVLTTSNIAEGSNLYYTDNRVWANVGANIGNLNAWTGANSSNIGNLNSWVNSNSSNIGNLNAWTSSNSSNIGNLNSWVATHNTTTGIAEGTNLYFTNTKARAAVGAVGSNLVYYEANGNFQVIVSTGGGGGTVDSVNGQTGTVVLTTSNIAEGSNLYYTDNRVWANVGSNIGNLNAWTSANSSNIGNLNSWVGSLTTTGIAEGANLYFTNARVYSALYNSTANTTPIAAQSIFLQDGASNGIIFDSPNAADYANISVQTNAGATYLTFYVGDNTADLFKFYAPSSNNGLQFNDQVVWHAGNDGAGSGLDADLLDGQQGSYYLSTTNLNEGTNLFFTNTRVRAAVGAVGSNLTYYEANGNYQVTVPGSNQQVIFNNNGQLGASSGLYYDGVSLKVNGNMESLYSNGDEGGEFFLNKSVTNTTLTNGVTIDVYRDKLRFFEAGGTNRGFYIDISTGTTNAGTDLTAGGGGGGAVTSVGSYTGAVSNAQLLAAVQAGGTSISFDQIHSSNNSYGTNFKVGDDAWIGDYNAANSIKIKGQQDAANGFISFGSNSFALGAAGAGELTYGGNKVYHAGNDGAGSGLDADLLDNNNSSYYTLTTNHTEGTNLFFTNTRARAAVTTAAANAKGLSYVESTGEFSLADSGATAAIYGGASQIPAVVVDRYGRITAASNVALSGSGTVTGFNFTGGIVTVTNPNTVPSLTVAGTSGGVVYFSSSSTWASSGALATSAIVIGGGAGNAPSTTTTGTGVLTAIGNAVNTNGGLVSQAGTLTSSTLLIGGGSGSGISTTTTGTGVLTALGVSVGSSGAFVVNGGALGTPTSGTVTNLTGTASININGTVGATTPAAGQFTSLVASGLFTSNTTAEVVTALSGATGVVTHDTALSAIFYHTSPAANFTANFTNVPTTDNRAISVTLVIAQGATPYICNAVQINGVSQTIRWQGGSAPTGTGSRWEAINFTLLDVGASWIVMGALFSHG